MINTTCVILAFIFETKNEALKKLIQRNLNIKPVENKKKRFRREKIVKSIKKEIEFELIIIKKLFSHFLVTILKTK